MLADETFVVITSSALFIQQISLLIDLNVWIKLAMLNLTDWNRKTWQAEENAFNKIFDSFSPNDLNESLYIDALITFSLIFLLDFHSTEGWKATRKNGVTRKRRKWWKAYEKAKLKEPRDKRCLLTLDLQPLRS